MPSVDAGFAASVTPLDTPPISAYATYAAYLQDSNQDETKIANKHYEAYLGRNPRTGESVRVPPKKLPVFRTGKDLRHRVDQSREQGVKLVESRRKPRND